MASDNEKKQETDRYYLAIEAEDVAIVDWDIITDKVYYSPRWKTMLGYGENETVENSLKEWLSHLHPDDLPKVNFELKTFLEGKSERYKCEFRLHHMKGYYRWFLCQGIMIRDKHGKATRLVCTQTDITEFKVNEQRLIYDAMHDSLTGIPNRTLFMDRLSQALLSRTPYAVLFLDVDNFKKINDTMGHKAGDELLQIIAKRLSHASRAGDSIGRWGGDEFSILLVNTSKVEEVKVFVDRLLNDIEKPVDIAKKKIKPMVSIGITLGDSLSYSRTDDVIQDADVALYKAKEAGKGRYVFYEEGMTSGKTTLYEREFFIKEALRKGEILLCFQPIVSLKTGRIEGLEALLRYHPETRQHNSQYLPLIEGLQLTPKLGKWLIEEACEDFIKLEPFFKDRKDFFFAINIFSQSLIDEGFIKELDELFQKKKINASRLYVEITEHTLISESAYMGQLIEDMKKHGFKISFDDFGTKYSPLNFLSQYPLDMLKLDRSFVKKMEEDEKYEMLISHLIKLADSMKLTVVAEGVNTPRALDLLREHDCEFGQGSMFSGALPFEQIKELLQAEPKW